MGRHAAVSNAMQVTYACSAQPAILRKLAKCELASHSGGFAPIARAMPAQGFHEVQRV